MTIYIYLSGREPRLEGVKLSILYTTVLREGILKIYPAHIEVTVNIIEYINRATIWQKSIVVSLRNKGISTEEFIYLIDHRVHDRESSVHPMVYTNTVYLSLASHWSIMTVLSEGNTGVVQAFATLIP